ncbi:aflatoxin B1 aldehyde reductase member 2 [Naviculisporaceae sp. PSN 640]
MAEPADTKKPRIVLGLMGFAPDEYTGARLTKLDDLKIALDVFQRRGYTELDTARVYGGGEQESYTWQAGWKDKGFSIATKIWPVPFGNYKPEVLTQLFGNHTPEALTLLFETSLKELGTNSVDILYLHAPDRSVPFAPALEALDTLHKAGKFKQLGLSNYTAFEVAEIVLTCHHNNWVRPTVYQANYNALQRGIEGELIPACRRYGLDILVYSPIAGGFLSGAYDASLLNASADKPTDGRFSDKFIGGAMREVVFKEANFRAVAELRKTTDKLGISPVEVALRWLRWHSKLNMDQEKGGNDGIIIGVSKLNHLDTNLDALEKGPLEQEVLDAVERMYKIAKAVEPGYTVFDVAYGYDTLKELFGK